MPAPSNPLPLPGRLPWLRLSLGVTQMALWLGPRSLIESQVFFHREGYRQFDYGQILAFTLRRTWRWTICGLLTFAIAAMFWMIAYLADGLIANLIATSLATLWTLLAFVNLRRGPTCRVQMQTTLGLRDLPTLNRVRPARIALRLIAEQIERVQGALSPAEASAKMDDFLAHPPTAR